MCAGSCCATYRARDVSSIRIKSILFADQISDCGDEATLVRDTGWGAGSSTCVEGSTHDDLEEEKVKRSEEIS